MSNPTKPKLQRLKDRLRAIDIVVEFRGNYPWVYLHSINGVRITEQRFSGHTYTVFMESNNQFYEPRNMFKLIRRYVEKQERLNE